MEETAIEIRFVCLGTECKYKVDNGLGNCVDLADGRCNCHELIVNELFEELRGYVYSLL